MKRLFLCSFSKKTKFCFCLKFLQNKGLISEDKQPVWYVLDEFGSKIRHHDNPSCRLVPFLHLTQQIAFSLLFPIADLDYGGKVDRRSLSNSIWVCEPKLSNILLDANIILYP